MDIEILKDLMDKKRFSQRKLAKEIGMSHPGLNKALSTGEFKVSTLEKIADVLEVDISVFFKSKKEYSELDSYSLEEVSLKEKLFKSLIKSSDEAKDEREWFAIIKLIKELEEDSFIEPKLFLSEYIIITKVSSYPLFDSDKFNRIKKIQERINKWRAKNLNLNNFDPITMMPDRSKIVNLTMHNFEYCSKDLKAEIEEAMNGFLNSLKDTLTRLVADSETFRELAMMGLLNILYKDIKFLKHYFDFDKKVFFYFSLQKDIDSTKKK